MIYRRTRAFTIVEAVLSVGIVGVLLVSSTAVFATIAKQRTNQVESRLATLLAQQLMTEIMQEAFQQTGTPTPFGANGKTRATFDAVDCYDGYSASPPVSGSGAALADYTGWTQAAAVAFVDPANPLTAVSASTLKRITVTVTAPSKKAYTLVGWRSKFGAYEKPPAARATYVTGVGVTLQAATPAKTVYTGAHPLNVATSQ